MWEKEPDDTMWVIIVELVQTAFRTGELAEEMVVKKTCRNVYFETALHSKAFQADVTLEVLSLFMDSRHMNFEVA